MSLHVPIAEDLISVLDRVLDQGIVLEAWVEVELEGTELWVGDAHASVASSAVRVGYGEQAHWEEGRRDETLFPYWQYDPWKMTPK
jgi:hypothetical protein